MTAQPPLGELIAGDSRRRGAGVLLGRAMDLRVIGSALARLARAPSRARPAATGVGRIHARMLRRSDGRVRRSWLFAAGQPVLSLTTVGRRSGQPRTTAVACFRDGDDLALAGMNLGSERTPAWALNLEADPQATIVLGGETIPVTARRARGDEAERLWQRWLEVQPSARALREVSGREIPLFVLTRR